MDEVSVWIPTYKRPEMLRTALRSVAAQTALKSVHEVVVIENGLDERSEAVCAEFDQLPLTYFRRPKSLPPGTRENTEAYKKTLRKFRTRLVAMLFDDDWWAPHHLARALEGFGQVPDGVASFCTCLWTTGEAGYLSGLHNDYISWFAAGGRRTTDRWVLSFPDLIVASQIATTFHYSSMVIDREIYLECVEAIGHENPYDTDRLLSVELGSHGKVISDSTPGAFVRVHPGAESMRLAVSGEAKRWYRHSTERLLERAKSRGLVLQDEFVIRLQSTGTSFKRIREASHLQNIDYLMKKGILDPSLEVGSKHLRSIKRLARMVTPPVLYDTLAGLQGPKPSSRT